MSLSNRFIRTFAIVAAGAISFSLSADGSPRFPQLKTSDLAGRTLNFPSDFGSPAALVFVAFQMKQQSDIDAWKAFADGERAKRALLAVWELPTIGSGYKFMRGIIEGGMRSGIKSEAARESTATLFLDAKAFAEAIGATDMERIAVLVVAPDGKIVGRASGRPDAASEAAIAAALTAGFEASR